MRLDQGVIEMKGSVFEIVNAVDVCREPEDTKTKPSDSGRILDIDSEDGADNEGQQNNNIGWPGACKRCLKLALLDRESSKVLVGIELTKLNWDGMVQDLIGKHVNIWIQSVLMLYYSCS